MVVWIESDAVVGASTCSKFCAGCVCAVRYELYSSSSPQEESSAGE